MDKIIAILIGGLMPAFAFGLAAVFQKGAVLNGVQTGTYLVYVGIMSVVGGLVLRVVFAESDWGVGGMPLALFGGLGMAIGTGGIAFAVQRLGAPISQIVPVTVISTLVTVLVSFIVFREHEGVSAPQLVLGALLVMAGAALVSTS